MPRKVSSQARPVGGGKPPLLCLRRGADFGEIPRAGELAHSVFQRQGRDAERNIPDKMISNLTITVLGDRPLTRRFYFAQAWGPHPDKRYRNVGILPMSRKATFRFSGTDTLAAPCYPRI